MTATFTQRVALQSRHAFEYDAATDSIVFYARADGSGWMIPGPPGQPGVWAQGLDFAMTTARVRRAWEIPADARITLRPL